MLSFLRYKFTYSLDICIITFIASFVTLLLAAVTCIFDVY